MRKLSDVLEFLDSIDAINYGGCGIAALAIYRWCKKHRVKFDTSPFVILCTYGDEWDIENNHTVIANRAFESLEFAHIVIEINGELVDSTGSPDCNHYCLRQPEQLNESELVTCLNIEYWNSWFDREESILLIEQALRIDLSDVSVF